MFVYFAFALSMNIEILSFNVFSSKQDGRQVWMMTKKKLKSNKIGSEMIFDLDGKGKVEIFPSPRSRRKQKFEMEM